MTGLAVCAALRVEAAALRRRLPSASVHHTGYGRRSLSWALSAQTSGALDGVTALAVAGVGLGTAPELRPGDVVVATSVEDLTRSPADVVGCSGAELLAAAVRELGCRVHVGRIATAPRLVRRADAVRLRLDGVAAVDLESAHLVRPARRLPLAVVRVVVDTPARPLARPDLVVRGPVALARLAALGPALQQWAASSVLKEIPR